MLNAIGGIVRSNSLSSDQIPKNFSDTLSNIRQISQQQEKLIVDNQKNCARKLKQNPEVLNQGGFKNRKRNQSYNDFVSKNG